MVGRIEAEGSGMAQHRAGDLWHCCRCTSPTEPRTAQRDLTVITILVFHVSCVILSVC
jgi:hypothetical protein